MSTNRLAIITPNGQLETISPNGTNRLAISAGGRIYQFPAWSPDGNSIAAIGYDINQDKAGVFIADQPNQPESDLRSIYESNAQHPFYLYWSPNSRYISFLTDHPRGGIALHLSPASRGVGQSRLLGLGRPYFWMWGTDSQSLLTHQGPPERQRYTVVSLLSPPFEHPTQTREALNTFQAPGFSPSGRYIAYANTDDDGLSQIIIENRQTRQRTPILHEGITTFSWSPTADTLALISSNQTTDQYHGLLRLVDAPTGHTRILTQETVLAFFWSPNGRHLAYFTRLHPPTSGNRRYITEGYAAGHPMPIPKNPTDIWLNLHLATPATRTTQLLTPLQPNPIFLKNLLPFYDQYALSHRLWSPDSRALVLPILAENNQYIVIIPTDGQTPPLPIATGVMASWSHQ